MTQKAKILVLNHHQIQQKITRIAFEIYERNAGEKQLTIVGLTGMGYVFAELMVTKLKEIASFDVQLIKVELDKSNPKIEEIILSEHEPLEGKSIILVDDVLNTGRTLAFAMVPFLELKVKKMEVLVFVNRSHKLFPVAADYTGYELATTLSEHITVNLDPNASTVHLH
ncbi:phosphoribosyltransferase family protein [Cyclobacterium qasimii]|uniref:Pyrimidine regulatory protein PyrR n=2 Tax=Cyclobacterium qasimii TaxID=1350429 RepID=S7WQ91_9BACT|nr:phosphoribosyltransferase family protein [Cyclobacterium qasimii]EPR66273.1 pyrimidine regulatory protein PyrR [Cyclobacterium qasimii M12-11B]GEO21018.1 phosphoribosyltransferase [Cyclobacterium qasimii]